MSSEGDERRPRRGGSLRGSNWSPRLSVVLTPGEHGSAGAAGRICGRYCVQSSRGPTSSAASNPAAPPSRGRSVGAPSHLAFLSRAHETFPGRRRVYPSPHPDPSPGCGSFRISYSSSSCYDCASPVSRRAGLAASRVSTSTSLASILLQKYHCTLGFGA